MSECEREDTRWKKEMVSDILLISTSLLQWTRWDEMPLRWESALHRYADVKNMPLWLFGRNSRMSTYGSLTQESCCCKKKPFSHPATFQRYQIKCCHIYTCLEGAGLFCKKAGWRQQQLKMFRKEGGGTGDSLTDGKSSVICFSSCVLPVETLVSVRNSEPLSCPCQAGSPPRGSWMLPGTRGCTISRRSTCVTGLCFSPALQIWDDRIIYEVWPLGMEFTLEYQWSSSRFLHPGPPARLSACISTSRAEFSSS